MFKLVKDPFLKEPFLPNLLEFRKEFDQVFDRFFGTPWEKEYFLPKAGFVPPVEAYIDNKLQKFFMKVVVPGIKPDELKLKLLGSTLTIYGEYKPVHEIENLEYLHKEIHFGKFERTLILPEGVDTDRLIAEYKNGLLELTAPVIGSALPRHVEIKMAMPEVKRVAI
jgi:HSP20 family protein